MRSDLDIRRDVEDELRSDADIDPTDIAVAVKDGIVTLAGFVRSFRQRRKAEQDVKRVAGVVSALSTISTYAYP
jgi:osmotically-inducible protein OsmY